MPAGLRPAYNIDAWRRRIPLLAQCIPMNNCSQAPQVDSTRAAAERYLDSWNRAGMDWDAWMSEVQLAKAEFAKIINASADHIAIFSSVSEATSAVASAIDFNGTRRGVLVSEAEFPTVGHVWLAQQSRGAQITWAPVRDGVIDPAEYDNRVDERTVVISACHAYYQNGFIQDIGRIAARARACGALSYIDAYQSLGAVPVDVKALGLDFLASGNLKFLMGIPGVAFLYVRPGLVETLEPTMTGWFGRVNPFAFETKALDWSSTASRFDTGTPPIANAYVSRAGMAIINEIGPAKIRMWHEQLSRRLIEGGRARGLTLHGTSDIAQKSAVTAFVVRDSHAVEAAMRARGVLPSARGDVIRLAPHFYSTLDDVDTALDMLAEVTRTA
ncbi:MAG TPA: aminotransferase class V-fold PLP-dependent enzyme [Gemmatimonadaceae bacterium]